MNYTRRANRPDANYYRNTRRRSLSGADRLGGRRRRRRGGGGTWGLVFLILLAAAGAAAWAYFG